MGHDFFFLGDQEVEQKPTGRTQPMWDTLQEGGWGGLAMGI